MSNRRRIYLTAFFFLLPTFAFLGLFNYFPAFSALYHAFTEWETATPPRWIGLGNFTQMWRDSFLRRSVSNQIILLVANLVKNLVFPLLAAELLVNLKSKRLQGWFRVGLVAPMVVPSMVTVMLWGMIYDPNIGLVNNTLYHLGLSQFSRAWLGDYHTALAAIIGIGFPWVGGLSFLIYLAGLMAVPTEVYDSCAMDGASGWRRLWSVDLPLLVGQIRLILILTIIGTLQDFATILILTGGGPGLATYVPALHMYFYAFRFGHYGYASAIGLVIFLVILAFTLLNQRLFRSSVEYV